MSLASELTAAASEAQGYLAQLSGMAAGAAGNFIGPDGKTYTMVFHAIDVTQAPPDGLQMQAHGWEDKSFVLASATRDQFGAPPLGWRRQHGTRLIPAPAADALIVSVSIDDPIYYFFTLGLAQPEGPGTHG